MNKFRKAMSVGMSAALLASLMTSIAATSVFAASTGFTVTGAGNVPTDGTSGAVSIAAVENGNGGWAAGTNTLTFTINDAAGNGTGTVDWSGTPVISGAPGSLTGISASIGTSGGFSVLTVTFAGSNTSQVENFTVGGMTITTVSAAVGAMDVIVNNPVGVPGGIGAGIGTASATLTGNLAAGAVAVPYAYDPGSFNFAISDANNGNLLFGDASAESRAISAAGNPLTLAVATANFHADGTALTQSVSVPGLLNGVGTVVATLYTNAEGSNPTTVLPGEQNQVINRGFELGEPLPGTLKVGTVVTFKIGTVGVLFSAPPLLEFGQDLYVNGSNAYHTPCPLSFDRTSCSVTVTAKSTLGDSYEQIELDEGNYSFDVAASVPLGTKVSLNVTTSQAGLPVVQNPNGSGTNVVAVVARVVVGVAAAPTIFINYNDQATGMITLTESGAGFFTAGAGNNYFGLCLQSGESFTRAPWAVVTVGDLKIRNGVVGAASAQGTLFTVGGKSCVEWIVYTASTVASTIEIRGSDASNVVLASGPLNGPRLSVPASLTPGPDAINILIGSQSGVEGNTAVTSQVSNAIRAYKSDIIVAAVSQPTIPAGSVGARAGNLTISETLNGQFKPGETICVAVEPRSSNHYNQDTYFNTASNNMLPVISTNAASGLIVGAVVPNANPCDRYTDTRAAFSFNIVQQAFAPNTGVITISNINYNVNADAPNGNVIVHVFRDVPNNCEGPCSAPGVDFGAFVSNAKIGTVVVGAGTATTRLGVTQIGAFTTATKIAKLGKYVTYRFDFGIAAAGQAVKVWGATKTGNDWSAFTVVTTRTANASGVVYYSVRQAAATWKSYRAAWTGGNAWTPARQARWIP